MGLGYEALIIHLVCRKIPKLKIRASKSLAWKQNAER